MAGDTPIARKRHRAAEAQLATPARLRGGALGLVANLLRRHRKCNYRALLDRACPSSVRQRAQCQSADGVRSSRRRASYWSSTPLTLSSLTPEETTQLLVRQGLKSDADMAGVHLGGSGPCDAIPLDACAAIAHQVGRSSASGRRPTQTALPRAYLRVRGSRAFRAARRQRGRSARALRQRAQPPRIRFLCVISRQRQLIRQS